jgi:hypothetical protein
VNLSFLDEWSGKGDDIYGTTARAFLICDENKYKSFRYDADGLGAGVRGDARVINSQRGRANQITVQPFQGSGEVLDPEKIVPGTERKNSDFFANAKAQAWWSLRLRLRATHRAVTGEDENGQKIAGKIDRDTILSINKNLNLLNKLLVELPQPTYAINPAGKVVVNKQPAGTRSPNLADAVMMRFAPLKAPMVISDSAMAWAKGQNIIGAGRRF